VTRIMLALLLMGTLTLAFDVPQVEAEETIYIRPDGTIEPATAPIQKVGDLYTFTDNIYNKSIVVQRNNLQLDGNEHTIEGSWSYANFIGFDLSGRKNVTIANVVVDGFINGIWLDSSYYNKIINNTLLRGRDYGVKLYMSFYNILANNTIINSGEAISLERSSFNTLLGNQVNNNYAGISIYVGKKNTLKNNTMTANKYNFFVGFFFLEYYIHDIDTSNTVDGNPIYYWINRHNQTVPLDAGTVFIVNSSQITVKDLKLRNNVNGVTLAYTHFSLIENVTATETNCGINLDHSLHNIVTRNYVTDSYGAGIGIMDWGFNNVTYNTVANTNGSGIWLEDTMWNTLIGNNITYSRGYGAPQEFNGGGILVDDSRYCKVFNNTVTRNWYGIVVGAGPSGYNLITGNNIVKNDYYGLVLYETVNNTIYHNNFIENKKQQASTYIKTSNTLDNNYPSGGNYWSDYTGVDLFNGPYQNLTGSDDIGDTSYVIDENNVDHYPLMHPWPYTPSVINVIATVDICPQTLNLRSEGKWVTAYIELPKGYNVTEIDATTILLNETIPIEPHRIDIGDYDNDNIPDLMVKFDRAKVIQLILNSVDTTQPNEKRFVTATLTITGKIGFKTSFRGTDTIKIIVASCGDAGSSNYKMKHFPSYRGRFTHILPF